MLVFPLVISLLVGLFMEMNTECWEKDGHCDNFFAVFAICVGPMWLCYICIAVADTLAIL